MKIFNFIALGILLMISAALPVQSAKLLGQDFPYHIFNDAGVIRYCIDPGTFATHVPCWSDGVAFSCKYLPMKEGYLGECKPSDESVN